MASPAVAQCVLDEALLVLALGVDRGLALVFSLAAAEGEGSAGECDTESGHGELQKYRVSVFLGGRNATAALRLGRTFPRCFSRNYVRRAIQPDGRR